MRIISEIMCVVVIVYLMIAGGKANPENLMLEYGWQKPLEVVDHLAKLGTYAQRLGTVSPRIRYSTVVIPLQLHKYEEYFKELRQRIPMSEQSINLQFPKFLQKGNMVIGKRHAEHLEQVETTLRKQLNSTNAHLEAAWTYEYTKFEVIKQVLDSPDVELTRVRRNWFGLATEWELSQVAAKVKAMNGGGLYALKVSKALEQVVNLHDLQLANMKVQVSNMNQISSNITQELKKLAGDEREFFLATVQQAVLLNIQAFQADMMAAISHLGNRISDLWLVMAETARGKVTPQLLTPTEIKNLTKHPSIVNGEQQAVTLHEYQYMKAELRKLPGSDSQIVMIAHIPIQTPEDAYQLWEIHSVQLPLSPTSKIRLEVEIPEGMLYLIKKGQQIIQLQKTELKNCMQQDSVWICSLPRVNFVESPSSECIKALTESQVSDQKVKCKTITHESQQKIEMIHVHSDLYLFEAPPHQTVQLRCRETPSSLSKVSDSELQLARVGQITLPSRCYMEMPNFRVETRYLEVQMLNQSLEQQEDPIWYSVSHGELLTSVLWEMFNENLTTRLDHLENIQETLHREQNLTVNNSRLQQYSKQGLLAIDSYIQLAKQEQEKVSWWPEENPSSYSVANGVMIIIILGLVVLGIYLLVTSRKKIHQMTHGSNFEKIMERIHSGPI